ncbi:NADPH-dependent F420 reductase [Candidatus Halobonum tyrrellensis]|uniref:NADPH-dependent F420 reductase n=1 Tax=Candidatus Halobonum tyrrellensis G22 TaxID=1324957 RepID=V4HAB1_9EURY|nr:NADPH-dependent F420 reductase [Candidatus Halobonum tyrrellensis]ESP86988.1 NADPH-dependent F420 reductase [Candidatus Halobonum tyrrellensis G22]
MQIALVGGTGDIGEGLTLRFGRDTDHELVVGSRTAEKAADAAAAYEETLADRGIDRSIEGADNETAVEGADVVILSVPPYHAEDTVDSVGDAVGDDAVLVSPAVGMQGDGDGLHYHPPSAGSVAALVADAAPEGVPVVAAFTNLSADRLTDLDEEFDLDTPLVGDDDDAKARVADLAEGVEGLGAVDAGPLANAAEVESLTPLVINVARYTDDLEHVGVKFV